ncbi:mefA [Symbiodinium sp. KB8]|nr:mefA [Symbiodinium sp. KB8]
MASTFRAVRGNRNSQLFFAGLLLSTIGTWVQFTAIAIVVDRLTGKATAIGILTALQFAPMLFFGAWGGAVSDRLDRRKMAIATQSMLAVQAATIAVLDFAGALSVGAIYVLTLALGLINALDNPARRGFVTELVPEHQIASVGLATQWLFTANALSFAAIIGSLVLLDPSRLHPPPRVARGGTPVRDGLRYVRRTPILWATFIVFTVVSTFGFNYNVVLPRIANEVWNDEAWFGWTLTAISVGSLLGSLATASRDRVSLRWMAGMGAILGVAQLGLAWAPSGFVAIGVGPIMGLGAAGFVAAMNSITQQECPPDMRGRILALTAVAFLGSYPIGGPLTGLVADTVGLPWSLAYGAVISLVAVGGLVWWALGRHPDDSRFEVLRTLLGSSTAVAPSTSERP